MKNIPQESYKDYQKTPLPLVREFELYRSNVELTTTYHGKAETPDCFELIMFKYKWGEPDILIRYPNHTDFFEVRGSFSSTRGLLAKGSIHDIITEINREWMFTSPEMAEMIDMFKCGDDIMLNFYTTCKSTDLLSLHKVEINSDEVTRLAGLNYVCIPNFWQPSYSYRLPDDGLTSYFLFCVYNSINHTEKAFYGNFDSGFIEVEVRNKVVARDGGTTYMDVVIDNTINKFYSPTPFKPQLSATWNNHKIIDATSTELKEFFKKAQLPQLKEVDYLVEVRQSEFNKYERFYLENKKQ